MKEQEKNPVSRIENNTNTIMNIYDMMGDDEENPILLKQCEVALLADISVSLAIIADSISKGDTGNE